MSQFREYAPFLYAPANRPGLENFLFGRKTEKISNIAICLEDAVRADDRLEALEILSCWLHRLAQPREMSCYVRPPDEEILKRLLDTPGIEYIDGFILPKATPKKLQAWAGHTGGNFPLLPILETREALDSGGRSDLVAACREVRHLIPRVRIGANDLFALLGGLRRPRGKTVYETPLGRVVDELIVVFSAAGLPLSGCVFDRIDDFETLARECRDDVSRGLFAKTAVNPLQVAVITESYHPDPSEIEEAQKILDEEAPAVFALNGSMHEPACHSAWAKGIMSRAEAFKLLPKDQEPLRIF